jgi:antitoxin YefM
MNTISYSAIRKSLAKTMEQVCDDHAPIIVTRQNAKPVVMLSLDDYESLEETVYLMRSPKNAARLAESIGEIESGKSRKRKLLE